MNFSFKRNFWITVILFIAILSRIGFEFLLRIFNEEFIVTEFFADLFRYSTYALTGVIFLSIIVKSEYNANKIPWLLILLVEPFTGLFLFLTFGRDYRESNRYEDHPLANEKQYLTREPQTDFELYEYQDIDSEITDIYKTAYNMTGHHAHLNDSRASVLTNGETFFPRLITELEQAKSFILMQFYIIRTDETGKAVFDILEQKAKEGVTVFVLYDALGSAFLNRTILRNLRESGVRIRAIDKIQFGFFDTRVNYRNHRKITIIDGRIGFLGGMNLANEYWNKSKRFPPFRDTQLVLEGLVLNSLTALFFRDWYYTTDEFIENADFYTATRVRETGLIQVVPSGPDFKYPPIRNMYVKMINNAKQSIKIMTPYLALDREMITSLMIASRGGVDVSIIIPGKPDKKLVYEVTQSFIEELLLEGIHIYRMTNTFTHAKVLIIDDTLASCGTYNLDNRSARINFEVTMLLFQQGVDKLIEDFANDLRASEEIRLHSWRKRNLFQRVFEGIVGLFSPLV